MAEIKLGDSRQMPTGTIVRFRKDLTKSHPIGIGYSHSIMKRFFDYEFIITSIAQGFTSSHYIADDGKEVDYVYGLSFAIPEQEEEYQKCDGTVVIEKLSVQNFMLEKVEDSPVSILKRINKELEEND